MLHKVNSTYRELAKYFPELKARLSSAQRSKQKLLDMAEKGEPRPKQITKLGVALSSYTRKKSQAHDPNFTKKIKKLRPDWFVTQAERAEEKKQILLNMAQKGKPKPKDSEKMGPLLYLYMKTDRNFAAKIRKLRPDWLFSEAEKKKRALVILAKTGKPKPRCPALLARALSNYTRKNSQVFDPAFTRKIRKLRPEWLLSQTQIANGKKRLLAETAKKGKPKPKDMRYSLVSYTAKSSAAYDPTFDKQIRKLAPHWFKQCSTR